MVDLGKIDDDDSGGSSGGGGGSKTEDEGSGEDADPFTLNEGARLSPGEQEITDETESLRKGAELNYNKSTSNKKSYKERQVEEVRELHDDMLENAEEYGEDVAQFTLVMHAMLMNFAQNRAGIAQVLMGEFGMNREAAIKQTNSICQAAGEKEMFETITNKLTKKLLETDGG